MSGASGWACHPTSSAYCHREWQSVRLTARLTGLLLGECDFVAGPGVCVWLAKLRICGGTRVHTHTPVTPWCCRDTAGTCAVCSLVRQG